MIRIENSELLKESKKQQMVIVKEGPWTVYIANDDSEINAHLIAAAPEMFHELESIICDLTRCIDGKYTLTEEEMQLYVKAFTEVCKKARGEK